MISIPCFSSILIDWFEENQRTLPWRGETDPYKIWVSEIILQQTRVNQGLEYYLKFIDRFPDVKSLAEASLQEVLQVWQGLGYYARARNMRNAAQRILKNHNGIFPNNYQEIINLCGIGKYTAAAIASIAFHLPYPAVDGNVLRVTTRIFGIYDDIAQQKTVRKITLFCEELMDKENPGTFNQALMEFGAIQCTPQNPNCNNCPFVYQCVAYTQNKIFLLPLKSVRLVIKNRYLHYFIFINNFQTIIEKRVENDIWQGLFQFPVIETSTPCENITETELFTSYLGNCEPKFLKEVKHKLTHQHLTIRFYVVNDYFPELKRNWVSVLIEDLKDYPCPAVFKNLLI